MHVGTAAVSYVLAIAELDEQLRERQAAPAVYVSAAGAPATDWCSGRRAPREPPDCRLVRMACDPLPWDEARRSRN